MSQININWHYVAEGLLLLALLFVFMVCVGLVIAYLSKKSPTVKKLVTVAEADAGKVIAMPQVQAELHSLESVAEKAASAAVAKLQSANPVTIANHPALTAVADALQESQQTKDTLAKVQSVLVQAQTVASSKTA